MGNLSEKDNLQDPGLEGWITLECILRKFDGVAWAGLIWLKTGTGCGLF